VASVELSASVLARLLALLLGVVNHGLFLAAISSMAAALWTGLQLGRGTLHGTAAAAANASLVLQFPLVHSALLGRRGGHLLARAFGTTHGRTLVTTTYAMSASLQLLVTFWLWSPTGAVLWQPTGVALAAHAAAFGASWILLGKAIVDSGFAVQSGLLGWWSVFRRRPPRYPGFATRGAFAYCRQPIYLAFALLLWTAPTWTIDRVLLGLVWTAYCLLGPLHKEHRYLLRHGEAYRAYQRRVGYFLPLPPRRP
jgi:protein-S-isoprenylcysteine O-methyltransferase Ste14